ncbi:hypothetical protein ACFFUS_17135 [Vibrio gallaecicus]|nr:hypothetical protein [Vibrio gallaecicus]
MKLAPDPGNYTEQQEIFTGVMISRIADHLESAGIKGDQLKELTGKIAFEMATMIDNSAEVKFDDIEAFPYLTFLSKDDQILHLGGNSYCHEYVYGILDAMFGGN